MRRFLVDEDMPRSTATVMRSAGFDTEDVRDVGLRARLDTEIFAYAIATSRAIVTADTGFANTLVYPLGHHAGIFVLRIPNEVSTDTTNATLLNALTVLAHEDISGALVIIEPGRVRIRRAP